LTRVKSNILVSANLGFGYSLAIGALTRDIQLVDIAGLTLGRATDDLDIGVLVESWEQCDTYATDSTGNPLAISAISPAGRQSRCDHS
jgi:predicted nucleotidyltransferase